MNHFEKVHVVQLYMLNSEEECSVSVASKKFWERTHQEELKRHFLDMLQEPLGPADMHEFDMAWNEAVLLTRALDLGGSHVSTAPPVQSQVREKCKHLIRHLLNEQDYEDDSYLSQSPKPLDPATSRERLYYVHRLTGVPLAQIKAFIRYMQDKPGELSRVSKQIIEDYLVQHIVAGTNGRRPTTEQIKELQLLTNLSRNQVWRQVVRVLDPPRKLTLGVKRALYDHLVQNQLTNHQTFTNETWNALQREFNLSRVQIRKLMQRMHWVKRMILRKRTAEMLTESTSESKSVSRSMTPRQKRQARRLLHSLNNPTFSLHLVDSVQNQIQPRVENRDELFRFIKYHLHSRNPITEDTKRAVEDALESNQNKIPTGDAMEALIQQTGVDRMRLHQLMRQMLEPPLQELSKDEKRNIETWIQEHFDVHTTNPREIVAGVKHQFNDLPRNQVLSVLRKLRDPPQELTPARRQFVHEFLESRNFEKPSSLEYEELAIKSGLAKMQVYKLVRYILRRAKEAPQQE